VSMHDDIWIQVLFVNYSHMFGIICFQQGVHVSDKVYVLGRYFEKFVSITLIISDLKSFSASSKLKGETTWEQSETHDHNKIFKDVSIMLAFISVHLLFCQAYKHIN